jgi:hypothetical protein
MVGGARDVAAFGDLLGGHHHSPLGCTSLSPPGLRCPTSVSVGVDRHRLPDGVVDDVRRFV